ncbi:MAG: NAD(P)H-hydrate dehydratase [bacterium]
MERTKINSAILRKLYVPSIESHKGQNGRLLIIAGSRKYHGAFYLCASMASKIVDFVYVHTTKDNFEIIKKMRERLAEFIYINKRDLSATIKESDAILMGPGLTPDANIKKLVNKILKENPHKKILLDAGALRVADIKFLHKKCVLTPHRQEFKALFNIEASMLAAREIAKKIPSIIILKGSTDYIFQNEKCFYNTTGNVGMTKGGTGDVLAGLLAALLTKTDAITAAQQAIYINGLAGDRLYKTKKQYYSASELIPEVQKILANKR